MGKTAIFGANNLSLSLAKKLKRTEGETFIITDLQDTPEDVAQFEDIGVNVIKNSSSDPATILELSDANISYAIAVTQDDARNIVACNLMRDLLEVNSTICRVSSSSYIQKYGYFAQRSSGLLVGVDKLISMEECVADRLASNLQFARGMDLRMLFDNRIAIMGLVVSHPVSFAQVDGLKGIGCSFAGVLRGSRFIFAVDNMHIYPGDVMYIGCKAEKMQDVYEFLHYKRFVLKKNNLIIIGAGVIGASLVNKFKQKPNAFNNIFVVEKNQDAATKLADNYRNANVICGDPIDEEVLEEACVGDGDLIICATQVDAANIMSSYLGRRLGCKFCASIVNEPICAEMLRTIGVDIVLNPVELFVEEAISSITSFFNTSFLADSTCALLEIEVESNNMRLVNRSIGEIEQRYKVHIMAIKSSNSVSAVPDEKYILKEGDKIAIWTSAMDIANLEGLIK